MYYAGANQASSSYKQNDMAPSAPFGMTPSSFEPDTNRLSFDEGLKHTPESVRFPTNSSEFTGEHGMVDAGNEMSGSVYSHTFGDCDAGQQSSGLKRGAEALESPLEPPSGREPTKQKSTRGARACTNCHRLKMKCEGAENGGPCLRCARSGHECIFLESHRGRKSEKRRKNTAMQQAFKKMEHMLFSVIENMNENGAIYGAGGENMLDRQSPRPNEERPGSSRSPGQESDNTTSPGIDSFVDRLQRLLVGRGLDKNPKTMRCLSDIAVNVMQRMGVLDERAWERLIESGDDSFFQKLVQSAVAQGVSHSSSTQQTAFREGTDSTRTNCLPDNTLNPLGLLAEASLQNWQRQRSSDKSPTQGNEQETDTTSSGPSPVNASAERMSASSAGRDANATGRGDKQFGLANETYFHSSMKANTSRQRLENESDYPPELLTEGLITSEETLELFSIFFHHCSLHLFLLDPEWHTPTLVCSRSPFLFTCVCSVASKFYTRRPDLYVQCLRKAIKMAFEVMSRGSKSPEIVQGFLLLTLYNQPAERYEEDRTWLFAGVAIRMAQDLNLHRKCAVADTNASEEEVREILNRERTWYICFCVDRTLSAQMGKPYSIREDWIIRHASDWCTQKYSRPWDLGICALVDLLRVQTRQLDFLYSSTVTPSGLNLEMDYPAILPSFNEQLNETMQFWYRLGLDSMMRAWRPILMDHANPRPEAQARKESHGEASEPNPAPASPSSKKPETSGAHAPRRDPSMSMFAHMPQELMHLTGHGMAEKIRVSTLLALHESGPPDDDADMTTRSMYYIARQAPLRYNYAVLVLNSFGLQYALERPSDGASVDKPLYLVRCVHAAKEIIATVKYGLREILRYAPDPTFVAVAYACVFLLKLIRPIFSNYINEEEVIALINYTIEVLEEAAVDPTHTPALYASFLRSLVQSRQESSWQSGTEKPASGDSAHDAGSHSPGAQAARLARIREMIHARGEPPMGRPDMTVNPTQVNPIAASLATSELHPKPGTDLGELHVGAMGPNLDMPMDAPPLDMHASKPTHDLPDVHSDGLSSTLGWDAMQYAKAQGVDVNRVLDTSFWSSLLPPGYGSGGTNPMSGTPLDPARESDFFKMPPSLNMNVRTSLTPGSTRASSPSLGLSTFPL